MPPPSLRVMLRELFSIFFWAQVKLENVLLGEIQTDRGRQTGID